MAAHPPRRPLPNGEAFFTPGATGLRRQVERRSAAPIVFLHQLPGWIVPLAFVAVLIIGFVVTGWVGAIALLFLAAFLGWFSYLSWPSIQLGGRLLRGLALTAVVVLAIAQAVR